MITILKHIPNALCVFRLAIVPVLWVMVWYVRAEKLSIYIFTGLVALGYISDLVDGILCRKYNLSSEFGAKFDRISDDFLTLNTVVWLWLIRPGLFSGYWPIIVGLLAMMAVSVGIQFWRFGKKISFHLLAGKIANWAIGLFAFGTFLWGPCRWAVWTMALVVGYALLEEILLASTAREDELDPHLVSMWSKKRWAKHEGEEDDGDDTTI